MEEDIEHKTSKSHLEIDEHELVFCKLCLSNCLQTDMFTIKKCHCTFCSECVQQYVEVMIKEGLVHSLTCPDGACSHQGRISADEVSNLVEKPIFDRYLRLKLKLDIEMDPSRTWCPKAGCETVCHVCSNEKIQSKPVHCPTCSLIFCSLCKAKWHEDQTCDENMENEEEAGIPFNPPEFAQIKRCPLCHVPIERDDGCAQMMCKRCKHVFCWYCLTSLEDDFLLRHYDDGPCKNRLGHSRASVIWHRMQVVGIFAGFGLLLLFASPFLLIAAPCILCCKCKCLSTSDEDEAATGDAVTSS